MYSMYFECFRSTEFDDFASQIVSRKGFHAQILPLLILLAVICQTTFDIRLFMESAAALSLPAKKILIFRIFKIY